MQTQRGRATQTCLLPRQEGLLAINQMFYPKVSHFQLLLSPPAWPFPCLAAVLQTSLNCLSSGCLLLRCLLPITQVSYKSVKEPQLQQGWHHVPVLLLVLTSPFAPHPLMVPTRDIAINMNLLVAVSTFPSCQPLHVGRGGGNTPPVLLGTHRCPVLSHFFHCPSSHQQIPPTKVVQRGRDALS